MSVATPQDQRRYAANINRFYVFRFLFAVQLILPIWVIYLLDVRHLSLGQITAMEGPFWLAMLLLEVPTGAIADRFGRVTSLRLGAIVNAGGMFLFAFAGNYPVLFGSYLALALAWTLFSGADSAFFYDTLKAVGREHDYQRLWGRSWALQSAGMAFSLIVGAGLAQLTTVHFSIIMGAVLTMPLIGMSFLLREPPRRSEGEVQAGFAEGTREAVRLIWRQPQVRAVMPFAAVVTGLSWVVGILGQPFLHEHGVSVGWWGVFMLPGEAASIIGALIAYRLVILFGFPRVFVLLVFMSAVPLLAFASVSSVLIFAAFPIASAVEGTGQPVVSDYVNRRIPSAQRATVLSFYSLIVSLFAGAMIPVTGFIADSQGLQAGYLFALLVGAVLIPPLYVIWLRMHRRYGTRPPVTDRDQLPEHTSVAAPHVGIAVHIEEPAAESAGGGSG
jgi:MFS family permease